MCVTKHITIHARESKSGLMIYHSKMQSVKKLLQVRSKLWKDLKFFSLRYRYQRWFACTCPWYGRDNNSIQSKWRLWNRWCQTHFQEYVRWRGKWKTEKVHYQCKKCKGSRRFLLCSYWRRFGSDCKLYLPRRIYLQMSINWIITQSKIIRLLIFSQTLNRIVPAINWYCKSIFFQQKQCC